MKTKNFLYLCLCLLAISCSKKEEQEESQASIMLKGNHELRKMKDFVGVTSSSSASFFLIMGDQSQESKTEVCVKFSWKMNDGTYAISSLPIEKFRIKLDSTATTPSIKFRWIRYDSNHIAQTQELMDGYVCYAVLIIREEDWPTEIKLPLN